MNIFVCVDDNFGLTFNHRRQSRDKAVCEHILKISEGKTLRMSPYSAKLFGEDVNAVISEDFLDIANENDFCFVEDGNLMPYREKIEKMYLFNWNREYPLDFELDLKPAQNGMKLTESYDIAGNSHEKISVEVYE